MTIFIIEYIHEFILFGCVFILPNLLQIIYIGVAFNFRTKLASSSLPYTPGVSLKYTKIQTTYKLES